MSLEDNTKDKTNQTPIPEGLRASERKYRLLIEANDVGYVILSTDGTVLDANQQYIAFTGHANLREILGRNICDWVAPQQKEACVRMIEKCLREDRIKDGDITYVDAKGKVTAIAIDAVVKRLDGTAQILALCRDTSTHKRDEDLWRREKQFTDAIFESAPFLLYEYDDQLRLIRWNKGAESITGYSATELHGKNLLEWFDDAELPLIREALQNVYLEGHTNVEAYLTMKNGEKVPYYFTAIRMIIEERVFFAGIGIDLTTQKQTEQALRESEVRLRLLIDNAAVPIGMGRNGVFIYANSKYLSMLGYESIEKIKGVSILEQFAPQFREQVGDFVRRREQGLPAPTEYEAIGQRIDGSQFPVHVAITRIQLADGPVSLAFVTDISARKLAEEELRRANELLKMERSALQRMHERLEATLDTLPDILFELDSEGRIADFHASKPQMLYVPPSQFLGKHMADVLPEEATRILLAAVAEADRLGQHHGASYSLSMPDGLRWFELSISRKGTPLSSDRSFIMLVREITDRKRVEEELARVNEQLRVEHEALHQKNIALQELVSQFNESRQSMSVHIQSNIEKIVLPILDRLTARLDPQGRHFLSLAKTSLSDIVSPFVNALESRSRKLTQREVELCDLIRRGHGSKEIAELRGCSVQTVIKQRKVIRKKLGIAGEAVNLASFLTGLLPGVESRPAQTHSK